MGAVGFLLLATLLWAGNSVVGRAMTHDIPPQALSFWRWVVALLVVLPFTWRGVWQHRAEVGQHFWRFCGLGALGIAGYNSFQYWALSVSPVINVVLVGSSLPLVMLPLAILFLGERMSGRAVGGIFLSMLAVLVVIGRGRLDNLLALQVAQGDLIMLGGVVVWALYTLLLRKTPLRMPGMVSLTVQIALGLWVILPFYGWEMLQLSKVSVPALGFSLTVPVGLTLLYVGVFPSLVSYYCWGRGVHLAGAARAGVFINFIPVFAALLAILFLHESFHLYHAVAFILLLMGVFMVNQQRNTPALK